VSLIPLLMINPIRSPASVDKFHSALLKVLSVESGSTQRTPRVSKIKLPIGMPKSWLAKERSTTEFKRSMKGEAQRQVFRSKLILSGPLKVSIEMKTLVVSSSLLNRLKINELLPETEISEIR
jgi:hypothetical protein